MGTVVVLVVAGCGAFDEGANPSNDPTTGGIDVTDSSESTLEASSSGEPIDTQASESSGDAPTGDPNYPPPTPVGELGDCPDGFLGPITFDGTGWGCIPECTADGECPDAGSGDAPGRCSTNPFSSATPCLDSNDCDVDGEMCGNAGMEQMACLLPPSHCILRCDEGQSCPDTMTCAQGVGICQYLP